MCSGFHFPGSATNLTRVCASSDGRAQHGNGGLRAILERLQLPSCRISFVGDSVILGVWTAAVVEALMVHRLKLVGCRFEAGHEIWHGKEDRGFCGANAQALLSGANRTARLRAMLRQDEDGIAARIFSSWARFALPAAAGGLRPRPTCAEVTLHYWESGHRKDLIGHWARGLMRPHAERVLGASSLVLLSAGTHANTPEELHELWGRDVRPYLDHLNRSHNTSHGRVEGAQSTRVVWLGIPPQHFATTSGSGTYSELTHPYTPCEPIRNATLAAWRNELFAEWIAPQRPVEGAWWWRELSIYGLLVDRSDLHTYDNKGWDCTHFCYTPWLYLPIWALVDLGLV